MLKKKTISVTEEKRIVLGLIVSTEFFKSIKEILKLDYFKNNYLKTLAVWCDVYFEQYGKAPYLHIQDIFDAESSSLKETDSELIETLLNSLSDQYDSENINVKYLEEMALDYFREREVEILLNNVSILKENGDIEEAEKSLTEFKRATSAIDYSVIINPGDLEQQEEIYRIRETEDKNFFKLPGDLGRYLGNQKRGDVVGYYGPAKRGKSFTLINQFKHGVLQRRRCVFWSIEMTKTEVLPRVNKAFYPMVDTDDGYYPYPAFDCIHNQTGDCRKRNSPVAVLDGDELTPDPSHVVCTKCKQHKKYRIRKKYQMAIYNKMIFRETDDIFSIRKQHKKVKKLFNNYGRLSVHKKYSLTYDYMMRDLDALFNRENFIPDIIIIDYIDILTINSKFDDYRLDDEKWKLLAKIAGETNTLVITATQANKAGHSTDILSAEHQGGYYGKNRHVNLMVGLNQKPEEKEMGLMRFGITEARDVKFTPGKTCAVLQDFNTGQAYLDSYYK